MVGIKQYIGTKSTQGVKLNSRDLKKKMYAGTRLFFYSESKLLIIPQ